MFGKYCRRKNREKMIIYIYVYEWKNNYLNIFLQHVRKKPNRTHMWIAFFDHLWFILQKFGPKILVPNVYFQKLYNIIIYIDDSKFATVKLFRKYRFIIFFSRTKFFYFFFQLGNQMHKIYSFGNFHCLFFNSLTNVVVTQISS